MITPTKTFGMILAVIAGLMLASTAPAANEDQKAVDEAVKGFYRALHTMLTGDITLMKEVWSHADDVTYMGPGGGMKTGWQDVLKDWERQAAMKLGGTVETSDMHMIIGTDIAIVQNYEKGEINVDGKTDPVSIRATNIFRKENGAWKMISHHTDILPTLAQKK